MEFAGVPHELIRRTARRSDRTAVRRAELEHENVIAAHDDGELRFRPVVSERARAELNRIAAKMTRPPKQRTRPLAQLPEWWKASAILTSGVAVDVVNSILERARGAAAAIRARAASGPRSWPVRSPAVARTPGEATRRSSIRCPGRRRAGASPRPPLPWRWFR